MATQGCSKCEPMRQRTCKMCGEAFEEPRRPGRPRDYCFTCEPVGWQIVRDSARLSGGSIGGGGRCGVVRRCLRRFLDGTTGSVWLCGLSESAVVNLLALGLLGAMAVLEALWLFLGTAPVNAQF